MLHCWSHCSKPYSSHIHYLLQSFVCLKNMVTTFEPCKLCHVLLTFASIIWLFIYDIFLSKTKKKKLTFILYDFYCLAYKISYLGAWDERKVRRNGTVVSLNKNDYFIFGLFKWLPVVILFNVKKRQLLLTILMNCSETKYLLILSISKRSTTVPTPLHINVELLATSPLTKSINCIER